MACADNSMDPTTQIAVQLGGAFAMLALGTLLMMKFGKKALTGMSDALANDKSFEDLAGDTMKSDIVASVAPACPRSCLSQPIYGERFRVRADADAV